MSCCRDSVPLCSSPTRHVAGIYGADAQLALGRTARLDAHGSARRGVPRRRPSASASGRSCGSTAAGSSSRSVAAARPTWPVSRQRPTCAACLGSPSRPHSSARSTRRSAARRRSTSAGARTSSAPSTGPSLTVIDPALLETLPEVERQAGMAEVVKTGLLAGEPLWEPPDAELVRRCAVYKTAVCLRDPHDRGRAHGAQSRAHVRARARGCGRLRDVDARRTRSRSACARPSGSRSTTSASTPPSPKRPTPSSRRSPCRSTSNEPGRR